MTADIGLLGRLAGSVIKEVERAIIGKSEILKQVMAAFLVGGHVLIEDFPGLGKTVMAKSFSQALGLELDASGFGMGQRSQRFAMVVDDGVVTQLHVEAAGEFKVSAAEYVLENL